MNTAALQKLALSQVVSSPSLPQGDNPVTNTAWTIEELIKGGYIQFASYDVNTQEYVFGKPQLTALSGMLNWTLTNYQPNTNSGFAGAAFQSTSGELVFAFRGTEPNLLTNPLQALQDFDQDLQIATNTNLPGVSQFEDAFSFWVETLQEVGVGNHSGYSFTGHSLGGGLAQYMVYATNETGHAVTFNAVGIGQGLDGVNPSNYHDSITDYVNQNDIIGQYGVQLGSTVYVTDTGNYSYNSATDNAQVALQLAIMQALKRGDITQAQAMAALNGIIEVGQGVHNTEGDLFFGAHGLDTLVNSNGSLSQEVAGPNPAIAALTQVVNSFFTVTGWVVNGIHYSAIEIIPAIGTATVKVTLAIADGLVEVVTTVGETTWDWVNFMGDTAADIIYSTAIAVGNAADAFADVAVTLYQYLFGDYVTINGTDNGESLSATLSKQTVINAYAGDDTVNGTGYNDILDGGFGADSIFGKESNDFIYGKQGNDTLQGNLGDDVLMGGEGNDKLYGDSYRYSMSWGHEYTDTGNDTLAGGAGNDELAGGNGNDTYMFGVGDGQDIIYDAGGSSSDVISFKAGISEEDIYLHRMGNDLYLRINDTTDDVTIKNFFYTADGGVGVVEQVRFADGTVWNEAVLREKARHITKSYANSDGSSTMYGYDGQQDIAHGDSLDNKIGTYSGNDLLYGNDGNDTLQGGDGDDMVLGGSGNDKVYGDTFSMYSAQYSGMGDDTLDGGSGNDFLGGGNGNDTYIHGIGYGQDEVYDSSGTGSLDTVSFKAGIAPEDIYLHRRSDDLYLRIGNSTDSITIKSFFYTGGGAVGAGVIEQVVFADGTIWNEALLREKARHLTESYVNSNGTTTMYGYNNQQDIVHGDTLGNVVYAYSSNDVIYGNDGNDKLHGGDGDDMIIGESGNDNLYGDNYNPNSWSSPWTGIGDDVLNGGIGDDSLNGGDGNDTYVFGVGDGQDTIEEVGGADKALLGHGEFATIFQRNNNDLQISVAGSTDSVLVKYWYSNDGYKIERFESADGDYITHIQVDQLIQAMASFSASNNGMSWGQALQDRPQDVQSVLSQYWTPATV